MTRNHIAALAVGAIAGIVGTGMAGTAMAQAPIKIGIIQTYSGPLSTPGTDASNGFSLYFEEIGMKVAGRPIQLLKEDDAANPAQAMERARRLVEREDVHMLTGITNSAVAYAMRDYVHGRQMPLIINGAAGANGITAERGSPYIFRASFTNWQLNAPFGPYACQKLGYKKVVIMASDFVTGHEQSGAFEDTYKKAGCEVVKKIFAPLGTVDFVPFLAQVPADQANAVWAMFFGADAIGFTKQYDSFGLKAKLPMVASAGLPDERLLPAMGPSAIGIVSGMTYTATLDTPANKHFVQTYRAKYNVTTDATSASGYTAAKAIVTALEAIKGKVEDKEAFLNALRKVHVTESPMGSFRFDDKQNVIFDMVVTKVEARDGTILPTKIDDLAKNIDQNWQYK